MTQLSKLKSASSLGDVAELLGFKPSALSYVLFHKDVASKYTRFEIPKRYGGTRKICAPSAELKLLQRRLADLLQNCVEAINEDSKREDFISHGFTRHRSIITNAKIHRGRQHVFNVDLSDFFGSINFGRVRGFFIKDNNFALSPAAATVIAQISCHDNALPQGSPCSPVISNLIGHVLDMHLVRLASRFGCTYSRYADDLTFSTNKKEFPLQVAGRVAGDEHRWEAGRELSRLVQKSGFEINANKTRMQYRDSRQEVTGLVVNRKVNVRREYRHIVRAMVHRMFATGSFDLVHKLVDENGAVSVIRQAGNMNQLHGMLGFIDGIDRHNIALRALDNRAHRDDKPTTKESLYRRFLLFKEFYATTNPVIICEGKTDDVYILHAIRSLVAEYPLLAAKDDTGAIQLGVRIYRYAETSTGHILGIASGGGANLSKFIREYARESKKFKSLGAQYPVIVLIDNDSGAAPIYSAVKEIAGTKPNGIEPFVHVTKNLYIVATPLRSGATESAIEDFFDTATKSVVVAGKRFDPSKSIDVATHYGKKIFAHKVVVPRADTIDFKEFRGILTNFTAVIAAHAKQYSSASVTT